MRSLIIISVIVLACVITLITLLSTAEKKPAKVFDERVTLRERDKIPYGYYAVRKILPSVFDGADVKSTEDSPSDWQLDPDSTGKVVFFPCLRFNASEEELEMLYRFAANGNHVFIISKNISYEAKTFLELNLTGVVSDGYSEDQGLVAKLVEPLVDKEVTYTYKGKKFSSVLHRPDTSRMFVFGENNEGDAQFIQFRAGHGTISVHLAPLAYSNYFLLHGQNVGYLEKSFSAVPDGISKVDWNEYYFKKRDVDDKKPGWLAVLFRFESFRWAFLTGLFLLVLYALMESRRRQRAIPVIKKPKNESLDFVETIGRLYYDRKDHKDLAMKMTSYFLDEVRNRYKLSTAVLDNSFVESLQAKSGYPADKLSELMETLHYMQVEPEISEGILYRYHKQLENFYQFS